MRRIVCILLILLLCYTGLNIIKVVNSNNEIYSMINQKTITYEKNREGKIKDLRERYYEYPDKVNELENYRKWNTEIVDYMQ